MKKTLLTASIAMLASTASFADDRPSVEAFLGIDRTDWDEARNVLDGNGVDVGAGVNLGDNWALEGWYARTDTEAKTGDTDVMIETASINALRYLAEGQTRPFVTFGASHLMLNPVIGSSLDDSTLDLGFGLKHYFENNAVIRGDIIAKIFEDDASSDDVNIDPTFRLSIGYAFGRSSKPSKPMPVVVEPAQPEPVEVAKDSDNDGVFDANDQCPNTPAGLKVDSDGCKIILSETVKIDLNIQFPNNSNEILDSYSSEIEKVADFMRQYEGTVVEVRGFTDDRGSAVYNLQLSEKRAKAVADKLVSDFGIDSKRVSAVGYGESNPIADNATARGRAQNRRVVAEVSTKVEKALSK